MSEIRVRPVRVVLQVEAVMDDGETLRPVSTAPLDVAAADWPTFDLDAAIADLQEQVNQSAI